MQMKASFSESRADVQSEGTMNITYCLRSVHPSVELSPGNALSWCRSSGHTCRREAQWLPGHRQGMTKDSDKVGNKNQDFGPLPPLHSSNCVFLSKTLDKEYLGVCFSNINFNCLFEI